MNKKLLFLAGLAPLVAAPALVVASCSSSTTDGSTSATPEQAKQAEDALKAAKFYLQFKAPFYSGALPSEVEFDPNFAPALQPSRNFGFRTIVTGAKGTSDKNDDTKGEKTVDIKVSKRVPDGVDSNGKPKTKEVSATTTLTLKGFLTKEQQENEKSNEKTKIADYINLDTISANSKASATNKVLRQATIYVKEVGKDASQEFTKANVDEFIKGLQEGDKKVVEKYLDLTAVSADKVDGVGYKTLVKKDGLTKENFQWTNLGLTKNGNIKTPSITGYLQLKDGDKLSGFVKVEFTGFKLLESYKDEVKPLIDSMVQDFGTLYNPIVDDEKIKNLSPEEVFNNPSNYLKSTDQGILLSQWDDVGGDLVMPLQMKATIVENKVKSFNNADGSITLELTLKRVGGTVEKDTEFKKELTIFGFKVS